MRKMEVLDHLQLYRDYGYISDIPDEKSTEELIVYYEQILNDIREKQKITNISNTIAMYNQFSEKILQILQGIILDDNFQNAIKTLVSPIFSKDIIFNFLIPLLNYETKIEYPDMVIELSIIYGLAVGPLEPYKYLIFDSFKNDQEVYEYLMMLDNYENLLTFKEPIE